MRKKIGRSVFLAAALHAMLFPALAAFAKEAKGPATNTEKASVQRFQAAPGSADGVLLMQARSLIGVLPQLMPGAERDTPALIALGKKLYFEQAVSINKTQSCNSCHPIDHRGAGADHLKTGKGAEGKFGDRNDPPTLNAGFQFAQFWDGRAADLEEQAKGPPLNPIEMGMPDAAAVEQRLKEIDQYAADFKAAFPGEEQPITFANFARAIAAFERTLRSTNRLDRFIAGEREALSGKEREGLQTFFAVGCIQCHSGPLLGGMTYQKMGLFHEYANTQDQGRFKVTNKPEDKFVFKTPMLRNVTLTAPYFHDGGVDNLAEAVDQMGYLQLNRELSKAQIESLLRFLTALADEERSLVPAAQKPGLDSPWKQPSMQDLPASEEGALIRYGYSLLQDTFAQLGPKAKDEKLRLSGNALACASCHQDSGAKRYGLPWMGVSQMYPQYRGREDKVQSLEERINGCLERSLNGKPLAVDSKEMKAMVAYINWLSKDMGKDTVGLGTPKFEAPDRRADLKQGQQGYQRFCMSCHGEQGQGYQAVSAGEAGSYAAPPLWGEESYNTGAGMNRLLTLAPFIQANMPLGTAWNTPWLSVDEAYDIAAYINAQKRPVMGGLDKDYPKLEKKPVDCPYPPYVDQFPQEQHQLGPFKPIQEALKAKKEQQPAAK